MTTMKQVQVEVAPPSVLHALSAEQWSQFAENGYLVLPDFFTPQEADELRDRAQHLLTEFDLSTHPRTIFTTTKHTGGADTELKFQSASSSSSSSSAATSTTARNPPGDNDYFLESSDRISFFFEKDAFLPDGSLRYAKERSINKVGHALHVLDPVFRAFTFHDRVKRVAKDIGFVHPIVLQSMIIYKQPHIGDEVLKHRDSTFLHTEPSTAVGMWFALEDCTETNGCLWFVPRSHRDGASTRRLVRDGEQRLSTNNLSLAEQEQRRAQSSHASSSDAPLDGPLRHHVQLVFRGEDRREYADDEFVCVPVRKGSMVLIHGDVVHMSTSNRSDRSRNIYTFHVIDRHETAYPVTNWLQSDQPFTPLF